MLNQCVLVGKVKESPIIKKTPNGTTTATLLLDVERAFRNSNGEIEYDVFAITLWRGIAEDCQACEPGTLVGIRGRLQANVHSASNDITYYNAEIIAEKLSFLSR
ncbi:single-stranded DNA-binding protein [Anaerorhabdus sp.]|uniref:single-stranded DNA-binding protein n=1 Tax=Anaerorhabdus sp. TaxID=1872524 RepID=UPI002FC75B4A